MAEAKQFIRPAISIVLIGATVLGAINTFGDNSEVRKLAESEACGKAGCAVTMTREAKNPISQSFTYQVSQEPIQTVDVDCKRAYVLLGDYTCLRTGSP